MWNFGRSIKIHLQSDMTMLSLGKEGWERGSRFVEMGLPMCALRNFLPGHTPTFR